MKITIIKSVISFILIATFSSWVFYSGWISLKLDEGEYALIYSKTSGYHSEIVKSGDFLWLWQAVIPGNVTLKTFRNDKTEHSFSLNVKLPSADYYRTWLYNEKETFSIMIQGHLFYTMSLESISETNSIENLVPEHINIQIDSIINALILDSYEEFDIYKDYPVISDLKEDLQNELSFHLPNINFSLLDIFSFSFPDKDLYKLAKKISEEREQALNLEEIKKIEHMGQWNRTQSEKFELLKEYGEIFRKYPELLNFFEIHNAEKLDIISLEQILPTISHSADSQEPVVPESN